MSFRGLEKEILELKTQFDLQEVVKRAVKYLIECACVAVAAFYIPGRKLKIEEILITHATV